MVLGHLEDDTEKEIKKMEIIAKFLTSKGVKVQSFYDKKAIWADIAKASENANFFIYRGHGVQLGEGGTWGGLSLVQSVSAADIAKIKLAANSLVLFQSVCGGAGSSASDNSDIGLKEANKRVNEYSNTFIKAGAAAYFAVNTQDGVLNTLKALFEGKTLQEAYAKACEYWYKIEFTRAVKKETPNIEISIASSEGGGTATRTTYINGVKTVEEIPSIKSYDVAYVAPLNFRLDNMLTPINSSTQPNSNKEPTKKPIPKK